MLRGLIVAIEHRALRRTKCCSKRASWVVNSRIGKHIRMWTRPSLGFARPRPGQYTFLARETCMCVRVNAIGGLFLGTGPNIGTSRLQHANSVYN